MPATWPPTLTELDPVAEVDLGTHAARTLNVHGIADTSRLITIDNIGAYAPAPDLTGYATTASVVAAITAHEADTTNVHGIADTSALVLTNDARLTNQRVPVDGSVTLAKLAFDPATQAELDAVSAAYAAADANLVTLAPATSARNRIQSSANGAVALTVRRRAAGDAANLIAVEDENGVTLGRFTSAGQVVSAGGGGTSADWYVGQLRGWTGGAATLDRGAAITPLNASSVGVLVTLNAAQTGNAYELRDSANALKASISPAGRVDATTYGFGSGISATITATNFELITNYAFSATGLLRTNGDLRAQNFLTAQTEVGAKGPGGEAGILFGSAGDTNLYRAAANVLTTDDQFRSNAGIIDSYAATGEFRIGGIKFITKDFSDNFTLGRSGSVLYAASPIAASAASAVGLIIKGAASQTGNLTEWRNSADTVLAKVTSGGNLQVDGSVIVGLIQSIYGAGALFLNHNFTTLPSVTISRTDAGAGFIEWPEQAVTPTAPSTNSVRVFAQDNGAGKTQLAVRFATGAVQILATEP